MGTNTRSTQMGPARRSRSPWLATDDESGTEPEDVYSQGDRPDPLKARWEQAVGGAVCGIRHLTPSHVILTKEAQCCEERMGGYSIPCQYSEFDTLHIMLAQMLFSPALRAAEQKNDVNQKYTVLLLETPGIWNLNQTDHVWTLCGGRE